MTTPSRCTRRIEDNNNIIEIPSYHYSLHPSLPASITSGRFDEWRVTTRIKKYNIRIIFPRDANALELYISFLSVPRVSITCYDCKDFIFIIRRETQVQRDN